MGQKVITIHASAFATLLAGMLFSQPLLAEVDEGFPEGAELIEVTESAADVAQREALDSIEANRDEVVAEILALFGSETDAVGLEQLEAGLQSASPEQLLAAQSAQSLDEVNNILSGATSGDFDGASVTNFGLLEFVPVTPCRIVNTTVVGGKFSPNNAREYSVYGALAASQGGSTCISPVGEPKGVMINMTAVPQSGATGGSFVVFPANVSAPSSSTVNYKYGVQNIANASSVKTYFGGANKDIEVLNRGGFAHLIIDVLGYYTDPSSGIDYGTSTSTITSISTSSSTPTEMIEVYTIAPEDSYCTVNASASTYASGTSFLYCNIQQDTNSVPDSVTSPYFYDYLTSGAHYSTIAGTRGYSHPVGGRYYRLACFKTTGTGVRYVYQPQITVNCTKRHY